jgi:hypothetical protein
MAMRVEWKHISDNGRMFKQAWLVCDVEGREVPVMVLYLGKDDPGAPRVELTFWEHARSALRPTHVLQPEMKDGALTFSPRPYQPGERDAIEQEIAQTMPTPDNWESTQSWVDRAAELATRHTYYLPVKRLP